MISTLTILRKKTFTYMIVQMKITHIRIYFQKFREICKFKKELKMDESTLWRPTWARKCIFFKAYILLI